MVGLHSTRGLLLELGCFSTILKTLLVLGYGGPIKDTVSIQSFFFFFFVK